ncbi:XapX domain-containing protein [Brevibacillus centrosporus]|uniref:XapX domain-containing protein n=1 Tax=Brevibacillus centrosporus TaxID=54910 RepID=UPI000F0A29B0|nr:XapX domain-containing protein [Brevibacillus centrosporus]MEC2127892.1 XapX domain-containing protein [Brevibacillus centrosporus]RNB68220.1 XapX domain-containing protein [Brevibacillus centrosporus]GED32862.1 hypothetical protein BCE02nite_40030 [Brevibacillus centrosporus]
MKELLLATCCGAIVGMVFSIVKFPMPAPSSLPGVLSIFGIYLGFKLVEWIREFM